MSSLENMDCEEVPFDSNELKLNILVKSTLVFKWAVQCTNQINFNLCYTKTVFEFVRSKIKLLQDNEQ